MDKKAIVLYVKRFEVLKSKKQILEIIKKAKENEFYEIFVIHYSLSREEQQNIYSTVFGLKKHDLFFMKVKKSDLKQEKSVLIKNVLSECKYNSATYISNNGMTEEISL